MNKRIYIFDNIKTLLMIMVIVGHFFELIKGNDHVDNVYKIIYTFHMPMFIFVSGYFAKFKPKTLVKKLVVPYLIFQFLYQLAKVGYVDGNAQFKDYAFQFTTPIWLLWYLMALILMYMTIPFIDTENNKKKCGIIAISVVLYFATKYCEDIGYYMSLARFFHFLPFFILGFYASKTKWDTIANIGKWKMIGRICVIPLLGVLFYMINHIELINNRALWGSYSYMGGNYTAYVDSLILVTALLWIIVIISYMPNISIPFVTNIGMNTFNIFIAHGLVIYWYRKNGFRSESLCYQLLEIGIVTLLIMIVFGNDYFKRMIMKSKSNN